MIINTATFIKSSTKSADCPSGDLPEFAFIGRSNVGKSSLINMLTGSSNLAKTSVNPGKTQTINHFLVNEKWFLVDLPGYGYAKVSAKTRERWMSFIEDYIRHRENLLSLFVLIDSRIKPQELDLQFMEFLGVNQVPFARVFTKTDKIGSVRLKESIDAYDKLMLESWESLPITFTSSSRKNRGKEEILFFIEETLKKYKNNSAFL